MTETTIETEMMVTEVREPYRGQKEATVEGMAEMSIGGSASISGSITIRGLELRPGQRFRVQLTLID